jgi:hypothetical protein
MFPWILSSSLITTSCKENQFLSERLLTAVAAAQYETTGLLRALVASFNSLRREFWGKLRRNSRYPYCRTSFETRTYRGANDTKCDALSSQIKYIKSNFQIKVVELIKFFFNILMGAGIAQCYSAWAMGCMIGGSIPGRGWECFSSPPRPDRLWGPLSLLSNGYQGFFPWG